MEYYSSYITKLVEQLGSLPGIGRKTAQRLAFHVLGLPEEAAQEFADAIMEAAKDGAFLSKEDFRIRTKVSKTVIELMSSLNLLGDIPESNQISLFDLV